MKTKLLSIALLFSIFICFSFASCEISNEDDESEKKGDIVSISSKNESCTLLEDTYESQMTVEINYSSGKTEELLLKKTFRYKKTQENFDFWGDQESFDSNSVLAMRTNIEIINEEINPLDVGEIHVRTEHILSIKEGLYCSFELNTEIEFGLFYCERYSISFPAPGYFQDLGVTCNEEEKIEKNGKLYCIRNIEFRYAQEFPERAIESVITIPLEREIAGVFVLKEYTLYTSIYRFIYDNKANVIGIKAYKPDDYKWSTYLLERISDTELKMTKDGYLWYKVTTNNEGKITAGEYYTSMFDGQTKIQKQEYEYIWSGDNIIKIKDLVLGNEHSYSYKDDNVTFFPHIWYSGTSNYFTYNYDKKKNPFFPLQNFLMVYESPMYHSDFDMMSINNIELGMFHGINSSFSVTRYSLVYNKEGYPIIKNVIYDTGQTGKYETFTYGWK